ncbi:MAG: hypothetical protein GY774_35225 [Planctomycetes bacterium]|nr:hypothetical protein [Planctomycetota bacterium]
MSTDPKDITIDASALAEHRMNSYISEDELRAFIAVLSRSSYIVTRVTSYQVSFIDAHNLTVDLFDDETGKYSTHMIRDLVGNCRLYSKHIIYDHLVNPQYLTPAKNLQLGMRLNLQGDTVLDPENIYPDEERVVVGIIGLSLDAGTHVLIAADNGQTYRVPLEHNVQSFGQL